MANLKALDADGVLQHLKSSGAGTDLDPLTVQHSDPVTQDLLQELVNSLPTGLSNGKLKVDLGSSDLLLASIQEQLVAIAGYTDTLESLLTTLNSYADGLEALLGTAITTNSAIAGFVDQLEGYTDGVEGNQIIQLDRTPVLGSATAANSIPVVLSSDGPFATNFGLKSDTAAASDTLSSSFIGLFKRLLERISLLFTLLPGALSNGRFLTESTSAEAALITETALTAAGSTTTRSMAGYSKATYQLDLTGVGTNVIVRVEGNLTGTGFSNLNTITNADTTLTVNKTYLFFFEGKVEQVRFTLVSFSGGTPSLAISLKRSS